MSPSNQALIFRTYHIVLPLQFISPLDTASSRVTEDLDEAIALSREALHLRPEGHPDRPMSSNNLAVHLSSRYKQLRVMEDLDLGAALNATISLGDVTIVNACAMALGILEDRWVIRTPVAKDVVNALRQSVLLLMETVRRS